MFKRLLRNLKLSYQFNSDTAHLLFHYVSDRRPNDNNLHAVELQKFISFIKYFQKKGSFIGADEYFHLLATKKSVANKFTLSFDDGYSETLKCILPVLEDMKIPSVYYVNSAFINGEVFWRDNVRYLIKNNLVKEFLLFANLDAALTETNFYSQTKDPNIISSKIIKESISNFLFQKGISLRQEYKFANIVEIKTIQSSDYMKVGNHTANHFVLNTLTDSEQYDEIKECQKLLELNFEKSKISRIFSMPFGGYHTFNDSTISLLQDFGFISSFISEPQHYLNGKKILNNTNGEFYTAKRFLPKNYMRFYI